MTLVLVIVIIILLAREGQSSRYMDDLEKRTKQLEERVNILSPGQKKL